MPMKIGPVVFFNLADRQTNQQTNKGTDQTKKHNLLGEGKKKKKTESKFKDRNMKVVVVSCTWMDGRHTSPAFG